jgi:hypothetical protein
MLGAGGFSCVRVMRHPSFALSYSCRQARSYVFVNDVVLGVVKDA